MIGWEIISCIIGYLKLNSYTVKRNLNIKFLPSSGPVVIFENIKRYFQNLRWSKNEKTAIFSSLNLSMACSNPTAALFVRGYQPETGLDSSDPPQGGLGVPARPLA